MEGMSKSPGLVAFAGRLRCDLGQDYFVEVSHWDGDRAAIGLCRPDHPRCLACLSVLAVGCEVYLECEIPASDDAGDVPCEVAASGDFADYEQIIGIVRSCLAR